MGTVHALLIVVGDVIVMIGIRNLLRESMWEVGRCREASAYLARPSEVSSIVNVDR